MMKQQQYTVVFMDLDMPVMNGIECSAAFREWEQATPARVQRQPICAVNSQKGIEELELCVQVR